MSVSKEKVSRKRKIDLDFDEDQRAETSRNYIKKLRSSGIQRLVPDALKSGRLNFSSLPDDALLMIFEQLGLKSNPKNIGQDTSKEFENDKKMCKISQVCKRWKQLIDSHHIFRKLNFFGEARKKREYENLLQSQRRYNDLKFVVQENAEIQMHYFQTFLPTQRHLKKTEVNFRDMRIADASSNLRNWLNNFRGVDIYSKIVNEPTFWIKQNGIYWDPELDIDALERRFMGGIMDRLRAHVVVFLNHLVPRNVRRDFDMYLR